MNADDDFEVAWDCRDLPQLRGRGLHSDKCPNVVSDAPVE